MCTERSRFTMSMSDASVVDLPEPVGPVTSTRPRGRCAHALHRRRRCRARRSRRSRTGSHASRSRRSRAAGTRSRGTGPCPGSAYDVSSSSSFSNFSRCFCVRIEIDHLADLRAVEDRQLGDRAQVAVHADDRRRARREVEVGTAPLDDEVEQIVDVQLVVERLVADDDVRRRARRVAVGRRRRSWRSRAMSSSRSATAGMIS